MISQTPGQFSIILQVPGGGICQPGTARLNPFGIYSQIKIIGCSRIILELFLGNASRR